MAFGDWNVNQYWNASLNSPPIRSGIGIQGKGYRVSVSGITHIDGNLIWNIGDIVLFVLDRWIRIPALSNILLLPKELPSTINTFWNNGGVLCVTEPSSLPSSPPSIPAQFWSNAGVVCVTQPSNIPTSPVLGAGVWDNDSVVCLI